MTIPPMIGQTIDGRYEVIEVLGEGGIGTVYKVRQIDADRIMALKILHPFGEDNGEFNARFLREGKTLNKLSHINIVTVYHLGVTAGGLPYLAMELVDGSSIRRILCESVRFEPVRALKIIRDCARALAYVHQEGIIHRDLKPENIILVDTPEPDTVKLIDFGLVGFNERSDQKLTKTGAVVGTVNYMSPEQCTGNRVDARSDIYSLCACLYEMLTGNMPYTSDTPVGIMYQHTSSPPPELNTSNTGKFKPEIADLIRKGMAKDPESRFQTMPELATALDTTIEIVEGRLIGKSQQKTAWLITAITVLALAAAICTWLAFKTKATTTARKSGFHVAHEHYSESAIEIATLKGRRDIARQMCDSTLSFSDVAFNQRSRIYVTRASLTPELGSIYYYHKALQLTDAYPKHRSYKLFVLACLAHTLKSQSLPLLALRRYAQIEKDIAINGLPTDTGDGYMFVPRLQCETLCDMAELKRYLGSAGDSAAYIAQALDSMSKRQDPNDPWVSAQDLTLRYGEKKLASNIINSCQIADLLADMAGACLRHNQKDLYELCLTRIKHVGFGVDGHQDLREVRKVVAVSKSLFEDGKVAEAQKLLLDLVPITFKMVRAERSITSDSLARILALEGIDPQRARDSLGVAHNPSLQRGKADVDVTKIIDEWSSRRTADIAAIDRALTFKSITIAQRFKLLFIRATLVPGDYTSTCEALIMAERNGISDSDWLSIRGIYADMLYGCGLPKSALKVYQSIIAQIDKNIQEIGKGKLSSDEMSLLHQAKLGTALISFDFGDLKKAKSILQECDFRYCSGMWQSGFETAQTIANTSLCQRMIQDSTNIDGVFRMASMAALHNRLDLVQNCIAKAESLLPNLTGKDFEIAKAEIILYKSMIAIETNKLDEARTILQSASASFADNLPAEMKETMCYRLSGLLVLCGLEHRADEIIKGITTAQANKFDTK